MEYFSVSRLRANLYQVVDRVIRSGRPVEIVRKGRRVRIVPETTDDPLAAVRPHPDYLTSDPESLVHIDWSREWRP